MSRLKIQPIVALLVSVLLATGAGASLVFDDSDPARMALSNDHFRFEFSKTNGAIVSVLDLSTGGQVSVGSRGGCLWGASTPPDTYVGGCSWDGAFSYEWDVEAQELTLSWMPTGSSTFAAAVTVSAAEGNWLDMRLELSGSFASRLDYVVFPSDVLFSEVDVQRVLLPILPGLVLNHGFFDENRSYTAKYPGEGMFSDFVAIEGLSGSLAIYALGEGSVYPSILGVVHDAADDGDRAYYTHSFAVRLSPGDSWNSPTVRWRIGDSLVGFARAFRVDSGIDALPSLRTRLGAFYPRLLRAPFLKIDMEVMRRPFEDYERLLHELPNPSVLHWVGFGVRGFDENYPDFLPPHPAHGTTEQFAALFREARVLGHFNMPYTNPTWWDDESPTIRDLPQPLTVSDIAVRDDGGAPRYETFGPKGGYAVSPWQPFVRQRADESVRQMTEEVPSDLLFQDQIGARPWIFDSNPAAPTATSYIEGWIEHTSRHRGVLLGTEQGFDALIPTEVAFFGSVPGEDDAWSMERFGRGNWEPFPFVPIVAGDKVLLYPHNMGANPPGDPTFRLNVAFGQMMMYTLHNPAASIFDSGPDGGLDIDGLRIVSAFQRQVISTYVTESIEDFDWIAPRVTRTKFESTEVIANADASSALAVDGYEVLPGGFLVRSDDGSLTAGVFGRYGGVPLSPGRHYVIEERGEGGIRLWKPGGGASAIIVRPLAAWTESTPVEVRAIDIRGRVMRTVPATRTQYGLLFQYSHSFDDTLVDHYEIVDPTRVPRRRGVRR